MIFGRLDGDDNAGSDLWNRHLSHFLVSYANCDLHQSKCKSMWIQYNMIKIRVVV